MFSPVRVGASHSGIPGTWSTLGMGGSVTAGCWSSSGVGVAIVPGSAGGAVAGAGARPVVMSGKGAALGLVPVHNLTRQSYIISHLSNFVSFSSNKQAFFRSSNLNFRKL